MRSAPGWHGKLPALGDFASRRLEPSFLQLWDRWLSEGLGQLRQAHPAGWLEQYLAAPSWRFLITPGVFPGPLGRCHWAGVLMPSVDRVGRYFPFSIVQALPQAPVQVPTLLQWLHQLDDVAADALHEDWDTERLERELAALPAPQQLHAPEVPGLPPLPPPEGLEIQLSGTADLVERLALAGAAAWLHATQGQSLWFADGEPPRLLRTQGLPAPAAFQRLFGSPAAPLPG